MNHAADSHQVRFSFAQLNAWAPGVTTATEWQEWANGIRTIAGVGEPALHQMPAMLRRHAGRLGRLACSPAYDTLGDLRDVPMVFSARYGEVSRSVELLTALSVGGELSPTMFGLSVHNAVPGLFSMARKETANSISLAAGDDSAEIGVIEACGLLADGAEQVLLVVADCPLPGVYSAFEDTAPVGFGWSCLILPPKDDVVALSWSDTDQMVPSNDQPGALAALALLLGQSREMFRISRQVGQNASSDPKPSPLEHSPAIGQNASSDPEFSSPDRRAPVRRVWHWSRNG